MSLTWYYERLRSMEPQELAFRVAEKIKRDVARNRLEGWSRYDDGSDVAPIIVGIKERLLKAAQAQPEYRQNTHDFAERILSGEFVALGVTWPRRSERDLFPPSLWRLDPVTGGNWPGPDVYCYDISYRHERALGDIKYVWEINRLQFLQPLAARALLERCERSITAIIDAVDSWYDSNPPFRGVGWNSGIELGLRAISLLIVTSLCGELLPSATRRKIRTLLRAHAFWMERYPSRFSSANNHLIAEAAGEFLLGLAFKDDARIRHLEPKAREILEREVLLQFFADGIPAEQSPTYGAFSAEMIAFCALAAIEADCPLSQALIDRLGRFAEFIRWLESEKGDVPSYGDDDEGRVVLASFHEPTYVSAIARCARSLAGKANPQAGRDNYDLRSALFPTMPGETGFPQGVKVFADGGYTVIREVRGGREVSILFDHGPLGYLAIAAHGHADALAFTLSLDGVPIFVDAGTFLYHSGGKWRDWFRGTRAHNTLSLGGEDQSRISGAFNWSSKAEALLEEATTGENWALLGSHDGYLKRFGVRHQRRLSSTASGFEICDRLLGSPCAEAAEIGFLLDHNLEAEPIRNRVDITLDGQRLCSITALDRTSFSILEAGELSGGWVSPAFGIKLPSRRLVWAGKVPAEGVSFKIEW